MGCCDGLVDGVSARLPARSWIRHGGMKLRLRGPVGVSALPTWTGCTHSGSTTRSAVAADSAGLSNPIRLPSSGVVGWLLPVWLRYVLSIPA